MLPIFALLPEILAAILETLGLMGTVVTILTFIKGALPDLAREHAPYAISDQAIAIAATVNSPTYGNAALLADADVNLALIHGWITDLTNGTTPVSLPVVPPSGYGGASYSDIANAVWNEAQAALPTTPADALQQVARSLNTTADFDMPLYSGIFRVSRIDWVDQSFYISAIEYPTFDPSDILVDDTLLSCLTRQNVGWTLSTPWGPQTFVGLDPGSGGKAHYITTIDEAEFALRYLGGAPPLIPPVGGLWPGLDGVTLGTPIALAEGMTIAGPLDGVIVSITGVPARMAAFDFDGLLSYRNAGSITFVTDNGDAETFQNLGFASAVYVPRFMVQAETCKLRCDPGITGTVTPWVRIT
jgi:hypothetical protein